MKLTDARLSPLFVHHSVAMQSDADIAAALAADKAAAKVLAKGITPQDGDLVGVRLNLNVLKSQGVLVQTLHAGNRSAGYKSNKGFYNGSVLAYQKFVTLREAYFNVSQSGRHKIASGLDSKHPMASVDGQLHNRSEADFSGIEVGFNPHRVHLFTDSDNRPVRFAEEVTIYGHRAYLRGYVEFYTADTAPAKVGDAPSAVVFPYGDADPASTTAVLDAPGHHPQTTLDLAFLLA